MQINDQYVEIMFISVFMHFYLKTQVNTGTSIDWTVGMYTIGVLFIGVDRSCFKSF